MSGLLKPYAGSHLITQGFPGANSNEPVGWLSPDQLRAKLVVVAGWSKRAHLHGAQDVAMPTGTDILAPEAGIIVQQGTIARFANGMIDGEHYTILQIHYDRVKNTQTLIEFTHENLPFIVPVGHRVARGQHIAESDNSGLSTGPHLHWQVCTGPATVSPGAIIWGSSGTRWDPAECLTGGKLAGSYWLAPNV